ncbi:LuxR C-terminal-related transcriptional regulator [Streptomyces sp. NPDC020681]|uniref:LuxR C-terminal-related transcriptional regulator n=1 Tax=Streptomyces sp. NPDC020681 TaxID=3365083 RepID=UPI0037B2FCD0
MTEHQVLDVPTTDIVRTAIIHDDPLQRAGIRSLVESSPLIDVIGDYGSMRAFAGVGAVPDVVLMGARQLQDRPSVITPAPGRTERDRSPAVVVLLWPDDTSTLRSAILQTVQGYVDPRTSDRDIRDAVVAASRGGTYLSSSIAEILVGWTASKMTSQTHSPADAAKELTIRECEVLTALGEGITNAQIARRLYIQEATVRSHVYHILSKLNLRTRTEAVLLGHSFGLDWW